jgi:hypothetical protein
MSLLVDVPLMQLKNGGLFRCFGFYRLARKRHAGQLISAGKSNDY